MADIPDKDRALGTEARRTDRGSDPCLLAHESHGEANRYRANEDH
jgi:hypothetical protein